MADPKRPTRGELSSIFQNPRVIRAFEGLFDAVPSDIDELAVLIEEASIGASLANGNALKALNLILADKVQGVFFDTTDQSASVINTATAVTFNNTIASHKVEIDSGTTSRLNILESGLYKFKFTIQLNA